MYNSKVVKRDLQYEAPIAASDPGATVNIEVAPGFIEAEAIEKAKALLEESAKHAEELRLNAVSEAADLINEAETHALAVRKMAEEAGYNNGYIQGEIDGQKKAIDNAAMMLSEINAIAEEMRRHKLEAARDIERELICIALETARKIMRQQCRVDTCAVSKMLDEIISETEGAIKLYLSEMQNTLEMHLDKNIVKKIRGFAKGLKTVIVSEPDSILIETETGIVDVSVDVQMEAIRSSLMAEYKADELHQEKAGGLH